jgi:hypothetical protein
MYNKHIKQTIKTILQSHINKNSMAKKNRLTGRPMDQNRSSRHKPMHLIFNKWAQSTQLLKESLFNKCCWEKWMSIFRRLKLGPCLSPCSKINSKWIKDLNIWPETLKQLQEWVGNTVEQIGIGNNFLNRTEKAQHLRETMNTCDWIKLKSFCTAKEIDSRLKRQPT